MCHTDRQLRPERGWDSSLPLLVPVSPARAGSAGTEPCSARVVELLEMPGFLQAERPWGKAFKEMCAGLTQGSWDTSARVSPPGAFRVTSPRADGICGTGL